MGIRAGFSSDHAADAHGCALEYQISQLRFMSDRDKLQTQHPVSVSPVNHALEKDKSETMLGT